MRENPELPVVSMVNGEITEDSCGFYMGAFGNAAIDEYLVCNRYAWAGLVLFKSDDDVFGTLEKYLTPEEFGSLPEGEAECRTEYDALPWVKVIIVYINLPE